MPRHDRMGELEKAADLPEGRDRAILSQRDFIYGQAGEGNGLARAKAAHKLVNASLRSADQGAARRSACVWPLPSSQTPNDPLLSGTRRLRRPTRRPMASSQLGYFPEFGAAPPCTPGLVSGTLPPSAPGFASTPGEPAAVGAPRAPGSPPFSF